MPRQEPVDQDEEVKDRLYDERGEHNVTISLISSGLL
jgi:hypothetical protein